MLYVLLFEGREQISVTLVTTTAQGCASDVNVRPCVLMLVYTMLRCAVVYTQKIKQQQYIHNVRMCVCMIV
jgi:hypothetical protein